MGASDWNVVKNTGVMSIIDEAGDHVWQIETQVAGAAQGYELYKNKVDFLDSEIKALVKHIDARYYHAAFVFRSDVGLSNAYIMFLYQIFHDGNWKMQIMLYKMQADALTLINAGAMFLFAETIWRSWRVRCWDLTFPPSTTVRFGVELETAPGVWTSTYSYDDLVGYRYGVTGRSGFGGRNLFAGGNRRVRFNDITLGHQV
jgi:hypothetical protein